MNASETIEASQILALQALAWCLEDARRAERLLDLTGLSKNDLRARADRSECQAAVLAFLESYEPDLIACADALDVKPQRLIAAREALEA